MNAPPLKFPHGPHFLDPMDPRPLSPKPVMNTDRVIFSVFKGEGLRRGRVKDGQPSVNIGLLHNLFQNASGLRSLKSAVSCNLPGPELRQYY